METDAVITDMQASRDALRGLLLKKTKDTASYDEFPRSHLMALLLNPVYRRLAVTAAAGFMVLATRGRSRTMVGSRWTTMATSLAAVLAGLRDQGR